MGSLSAALANSASASCSVSFDLSVVGGWICVFAAGGLNHGFAGSAGCGWIGMPLGKLSGVGIGQRLIITQRGPWNCGMQKGN